MKISRKRRKLLRETYPKEVIRKALKKSNSEKALKENLEIYYESYKRKLHLNYNPYSGTPLPNVKEKCHQ